MKRKRLFWLAGLVVLVIGPCTAALFWRFQDDSLLTLPGHRIGSPSARVCSLAFNPDGTCLASGGRNSIDDKTLKIWDVESGELIRAFNAHEMGGDMTVAFSPDGTILATGGEDGTAKLWRVTDAGLVHTLRVEEFGTKAIAFSDDGKLLATGGLLGGIKLWEVASGKEVGRLEGHGESVSSLGFSKSRKYLASGDAKGSVVVHELASNERLHALEGSGGPVACLSFDAEERRLTAGSRSGTVKIWEIRTGNCVQTVQLAEGQPCTVALSTDLRTIAVGSRSAFKGTTLPTPFHTRDPLLWGGDRPIRLYDRANGNVLRSLVGHKQDGIFSLAFTSDGSLLASGSDNGTIKLWKCR
jgi:WD40 repeat protein